MSKPNASNENEGITGKQDVQLLLCWPEQPWRRIEQHLREMKGAVQRVEGQGAMLDGDTTVHFASIQPPPLKIKAFLIRTPS